MSTPTPRELLALADRQRAVATTAEDFCRNVRLLRAPVRHKRSGLLGFVRDRSREPDPRVFESIDGPLLEALYRAMGKVLAEARDEAARIESSVVAKGAGQ